jgi:AraC family transcriptional regulator
MHAPYGAKMRQVPRSQAWVAAHQTSPMGSSDLFRTYLPENGVTPDTAHPAVEISPPEAVTRRTVTGHGIVAESVQVTSPSRIRYHFRSPIHLLVMHEKGVRRDGETFVEGLPRSTLRNLERKLTFVPAHHEYHEWHEPRSHHRLMHFYFDPAKIHSEQGINDISVAPRLLFEDATLWSTALKLKTLVESPASGDQIYFEAIGTLLVHELMRFNRGAPGIQRRFQGGLAPWQQRIALAYIEEHLNERIPLTTLVQLVRLSTPQYLCRLFKQSLGMPPHRYQTNRRMEQAKLLLARRSVSVTDVALTVGFGSSNAFATAFRKATGFTPTDYRQSLVP